MNFEYLSTKLSQAWKIGLILIVNTIIDLHDISKRKKLMILSAKKLLQQSWQEQFFPQFFLPISS